VTRLNALTGYRPKVMLAEGLERFAAWYRGFYPA
jgi:UDP-glucuronate 4-epimerase